jgi:cysteine desulfurase
MSSVSTSHRPIYLDHQATTPVDPRVLAAMVPYFTEKFGNAASGSHAFGWEAAEAVDLARQQVARILGTVPESLIFTSGATEANNLALKGILHRSPPGSHLIINAAEHRAVLDPAKRLQREGFAVTLLPVSPEGRVDPQQVADALRPNTVLVSVMAANNEVGTLNPLHEIGTICRQHNVWLHCDAAQAVGKIPLDLEKLPVDLLSISAHKLYGPKGVGALFVRRGERRIQLEPLFHGGGHEQRLRSGTLPVPLIVGLGAACEIAMQEQAAESLRLSKLTETLWQGLSSRLDGVTLNGPWPERLSGNLNVSFAGVAGDALLTSLTEIAVSSGSACTSADPEPSHVLRAMGISEPLALASLRFGVGRFNNAAEIDVAIDCVVRHVTRLRQSSSAAGSQG